MPRYKIETLTIIYDANSDHISYLIEIMPRLYYKNIA